MHVIATTRLTLEPQVAAHAPAMFAVLGDPAMYQHDGAPPPSLEWLRTRYAKLESRRSPDGQDQWLNWVVRLCSSELIGYVQATVRPDGQAVIAYEMASAYWGRGLAHEAVQAMIDELVRRYGVRELSAVLKRENLRSMRLLQRLGFTAAAPALHVERDVASDEALMRRGIAGGG